MNDKVFKIVIAVVIIGALGAGLIFKDDTPDKIRLGDEHVDNGAEHIASEADIPEYDGVAPPTSGNHAGAVEKGVYTNELPDINTIHNLEHGYVYVSYQPTLPQEDIDKLAALFFAPFSNEKFAPSKVIMAPRAANESPIILSSWRRDLKFDVYAEQQMMDYYLGNVNKSPEPLAQ